MSDGGWDKVNLGELVGSALVSAGVGMIRVLMLIRAGRNVAWVDVILEPSIAIFAGMCAWALTEVANSPDVLQAVMTSIGAWSGPRLIRQLEKRYFGGTRAGDTGPGDLSNK